MNTIRSMKTNEFVQLHRNKEVSIKMTENELDTMMHILLMCGYDFYENSERSENNKHQHQEEIHSLVGKVQSSYVKEEN